MTTALDKGASVDDAFRDRLLDGLAASIGERGYRDSTVADIVRHARTSKRTFYEQFASKEDCLIEVLRRNNADLIATIQAAVDPEAEWQDQIRQASNAYVDHIASRPAITLSWIREAPALGVVAVVVIGSPWSSSPTCLSISPTVPGSGARSCCRFPDHLP
jgi:AcrR family transcriptional regulator